jgi:ribonuclease HI
MAHGKHLGLTFSPSKSELLHCLPRTSKDKTTDLSYHLPLTINDQTILQSQSVKYLGVHIHESLTFNKHGITAASLSKSSRGALLFLCD